MLSQTRTRWFSGLSMAVAALLSGSIAARASGDQIFFVDIFVPDATFGSIRSIQDDGSNLDTHLDTGGGALALDIDPINSKIYFVDVYGPAIMRCNLDGTNPEAIVTENLEYPSALAVDPVGGKIYWGDQLALELRRANLDGSNQQLLRSTAFHRGIALDLENGKVYWSTSDTIVKGKILRCNLDGTGLQTVVQSTTPEFKPSAIALDIAGGKVYWTDYVVDMVRRSNLDGTEVDDLWTAPGNFNPRGIELDLKAGRVYWGQDVDFDGTSGNLMTMQLDGAFPEPVAENLGLVNYLSLYEDSQPCPADVVPSGAVDVDDLLAVINAWGECKSQGFCEGDVDLDGTVDVDDLLAVINEWGACPPF